MTIILTKSAGTNSTTTTSSSASPIIEDYYITPDDNTTNNYNDDEETTTTTTDGDSSNYDDDDDTISLSTTGTDDRRNPLDKLTQHDIDTSQHSTTSRSTTSSSTTGGHSYIDNLLAQEILHDYNDGDLQILNALVNKLHEADVTRRKREEAKAIEAEQQRRIAGLVEGRTVGDYDGVDYCVEDDDEEDYYSCCEDHCGTNQHVHHHHTPQRRNRHTAAKHVTAAISAATADLPSEMPLHPPSFSPLTPTNNNTNSNTTTNDKRELSISSVDSSLHGPSIELVPTSQIQHILPSWNQSWKEERLEWKLLLDESQRAKRERSIRSASAAGRRFRRSNSTATVVNGSASKRSGNATTNHDNVTTTTTTVRRNRSAPNNTTIRVWGGTTTSIPSNTTNNLTTLRTRSSTTYQNRYGKPKPITTTPNPIVTKSSKKIHRRHARYALTAGMMLGVRESVGGANGVECELEAKMWEESEVEDGFIIENIMEGRKKLTSSARSTTTSEEKNRDKKEQKQVRQRIEVVLGPLKVSTLDNTPSNDEQDDELSQCTQEAQQYHDNFLTTQCERISKYKFSPQTFYLGSNTSEPLPHKYKFKVYAPVVFQRIRTLFGVEKQTFLHSICGKFNLYEFASNAKSGQFFFYSHDGRYMIKTLTYTEQKFLRLILPAYYRHLTRHPHTFLTHFYGLYRVCMPNADNTRLHFVIMRSVFHTEKKIDRVWDLKGSTVGRKSEEGESVLKDLDILEEGKKLRFKHGSEREAFLKQLEVDAAFLATMGIMDYSLLLGLHNDCDDGCCSTSGGGAGSAIDQITPTQSVRKRLDTGDDSLATKGSTELPMTNTPHRRNVLMRKTINGTSPPKPPPPPSLASAKGGGGGRSSPMKSSPPQSSLASNPITSMSDLGIQGGTPLRPETYYCGIIDILQYYNARKMGETVIKKAAGGDADNISCVDPETYGKRFVKFIGDLAE